MFQNRLSAHATLARVHFSKIFRESWKTKRKEKTNLVEEACKICLNIIFPGQLATGWLLVVPYRKENAPDTCYAGAVAYGNAVHHLASSTKTSHFVIFRTTFHALSAKSNFSKYNDGISNAIINNAAIN